MRPFASFVEIVMFLFLFLPALHDFFNRQQTSDTVS